VGGEVGAERGGKELPAIVTLHTTDGDVKLSEDKHKETKQGITCIRFGTQGKNP
jgi:hypothetical protein